MLWLVGWFFEEWLILRLGQEIQKVNVVHYVVPESQKVANPTKYKTLKPYNADGMLKWPRKQLTELSMARTKTIEKQNKVDCNPK